MNHGEVAERIESHAELEDLLGVQITSPAGCATPDVDVVDPKYVLPALQLLDRHRRERRSGARGRRRACSAAWASPATSARIDFETSVALEPGSDRRRRAAPRTQANNVCPRPPDPDPEADDPGCGAKLPDKTLGGPIVTDIIEK